MKLKTRFDVWERDYYSKGFAVCEPDIINDVMYCRFRDEEFEIPSAEDMDLVEGMGPMTGDETRWSMLHAEVSKLRKWKAAKTARK